jgi:hypothetical protein
MLDVGLWKLAGTAMASALVTGAAAWWSFGAHVVTDAEMKTYVSEQIAHERELREPFVETMRGVKEQFEQFHLEQRTTNSRLETLIEVMRGNNE